MLCLIEKGSRFPFYFHPSFILTIDALPSHELVFYVVHSELRFFFEKKMKGNLMTYAFYDLRIRRIRASLIDNEKKKFLVIDTSYYIFL